ncbi:hypothetical protein Cni_G02424 [Canna indica]|uniref:Reverse transcriptase domain-containing protein n=1 Tax=Canna indica TaxID=4628 RepID=A0AAQ3JP79_9LILI|nr:hypothetical protein Cni_G02424 [Canna indica]
MKNDFSISHLMFANDFILILRANKKSITSDKRIFSSYESLTGLRINPSKFSIYFLSHTSNATKLSICNSLGMRKGSFPLKYIRVMISPRRSPPKTHEHILTSIDSKLFLEGQPPIASRGGLGIQDLDSKRISLQASRIQKYFP